MTGIYIHVPFCKRKCPYCDFYSVCRPELYEDYTQAVCRNIEAFKGRDILSTSVAVRPLCCRLNRLTG